MNGTCWPLDVNAVRSASQHSKHFRLEDESAGRIQRMDLRLRMLTGREMRAQKVQKASVSTMYGLPDGAGTGSSDVLARNK